MVEINNQRKAFLDMLAWSEGTDKTDAQQPEIMVMTSLQARAIYYHPITLQTCHAKPKTQNQQALDATSFFPAGGMPTASSLA